MKKQQAAYKNHLFFLVALSMLLAVAGCVMAAPGNDDVLARLGLSSASAKEGVLDSLASGNVYNDAAFRAFKLLPAPARAGIVRAGLEWIKTYAGSAEFKAAYAEFRRVKKPALPAPRPSADDEIKKMKAELEKNIAEMRKNMAAMDAQTKKDMEEAIQAMRGQMERMERDPQQKELMRQSTEMSAEEDKKRHEEALAEWEQRYPADPRALIKKRINEFLAASTGVDYAAKLAPHGDKMIFANGEYEQKPAEWKLCFRAGKEATEAARSFAKSWLAELDKN